MVQQAASAILGAYRDGISRQWVRLRLGMVPLEEKLSDQWQWDADRGWRRLPLPPGGVPALHDATLPLVEQLVQGLGGNSELRDLRVALIDEEDSPDIGTLLYREAVDSKEDVAVFFLAGRSFAVADSTPAFLSGMKQRLVVMLNSEDAASTFKVENHGEDFRFTSEMWKVDTAAKFCETFAAQTYHYSLNFINGWPVVLFRVYPHPWETYIEGVDDCLQKLRETNDKPSIEEISRWTIEYEAEKGVTLAAKLDKSLRDPDRA